MPPLHNPQWQIPGAFSAAVLGEELSKKHPRSERLPGWASDEGAYFDWLEGMKGEAKSRNLSLEDTVGFVAFDDQPTDMNLLFAQQFFLRSQNAGMSKAEILELTPAGLEPPAAFEQRVGPERTKLADAALAEMKERAKSVRESVGGIGLHESDYGTTLSSKATMEETGEGAASKGAADFEGGPAKVIMQNGRIFDAEDVREDGEFYTLDFGDGNEMSVPKSKVEAIKFGEQKRIEALETAPRPRR